MIGFGILIELNSFDLGSTLASRLCDTVPPVHHSPISGNKVELWEPKAWDDKNKDA